MRTWKQKTVLCACSKNNANTVFSQKIRLCLQKQQIPAGHLERTPWVNTDHARPRLSGSNTILAKWLTTRINTQGAQSYRIKTQLDHTCSSADPSRDIYVKPPDTVRVRSSCGLTVCNFKEAKWNCKCLRRVQPVAYTQCRQMQDMQSLFSYLCSSTYVYKCSNECSSHQ